MDEADDSSSFGCRDHYLVNGEGLERVNIVRMTRYPWRSLPILAVYGLTLVTIFNEHGSMDTTAVDTGTACQWT